MASGIQDIPLRRIPQEWDRQWFADFVRDVLRLGDARNMRVGDEMELTGQSGEVATLSMAPGGIGLDRIEAQPGLSVIGNPTDSTALLQSIVAASDLQVLRRSGLAVGFGSITSAYISDFQEASEDVTAALIDDGTGLNWAYDDVLGSLVGTVTLAPFSTTDLAEGSNLYFTDERSQDATAALIQSGTGISWSYNDGANTLTPTVTLAPFSTTNLSEGSNLYFTDERAQDAVGGILTDSSRIDLTYNDGSNTITADLIAASVANSFLANMVQSRIKGRAEGAGTGDPTDLTPTQVAAIIDGEAITWSALHTFTRAGDFGTPTILLSSARPVVILTETDLADVDGQRWGLQASGGSLELRAIDSTGGATTVIMGVARTGLAITGISFGNATNNPTYAFTGSGIATFSGQVTALRFVPSNSTIPTNGLYLPSANNPALSANSTKVIEWTSTLATITGNLSLGTAGNKMLVKEGTNASMGVATLVAGTVVVNTTLVTANSRIFLTVQALGTVAVATPVSVTARTANTSFTITSSAITDTSVIAWHIVEPA